MLLGAQSINTARVSLASEVKAKTQTRPVTLQRAPVSGYVFKHRIVDKSVPNAVENRRSEVSSSFEQIKWLFYFQKANIKSFKISIQF